MDSWKEEMLAATSHITPYHMEQELYYCHGMDAITGETGWFVYKDTTIGKVATTPVFDEWCKLLFYIGQEGYTFSRTQERTFIKRPPAALAEVV